MTFTNKTIETIESAYLEGLKISFKYPTKGGSTWTLTQDRICALFTNFEVNTVIRTNKSLKIYTTDGPTLEFSAEEEE